MRIYRATFSNQGESYGFGFYSSRAAALKECSDIKKLREEEEITCSIELINVKPTKAGIISALNLYGGHPDNG